MLFRRFVAAEAPGGKSKPAQRVPRLALHGGLAEVEGLFDSTRSGIVASAGDRDLLVGRGPAIIESQRTAADVDAAAS